MHGGAHEFIINHVASMGLSINNKLQLYTMVKDIVKFMWWRKIYMSIILEH